MTKPADNSPDNRNHSRRAVLGSLAATSTLIPLLGSDPARAAAASAAGTWSAEYRLPKGRIELMLYRRCAARPVRGSSAPVLVLVHGSTAAALSSYDLRVASGREYSMMNVFARLGYDVWAIDFDGYGRSGWSGGNSDIADGAADLALMATVIERETGRKRYNFYGQSSGALRVGVFATRHPERVDRIALESFVWTGEGSTTLTARRRNVEAYRASPRRERSRDSMTAMLTRDSADAVDREVVDAILAAELPFGPLVPSGTYLDMVTRLPIVDPAKLACPVMIARGEHDGIATEADLLGFLTRLSNPSRTYCSFGGGAHGLVTSGVRASLFRTLDAFLRSPDDGSPR